MIKLLKKKKKSSELSTPPIQSFHSLFYNYLKLTQIMSWGLQQAEHLGCFSSTDAFAVALLEEKERGKIHQYNFNTDIQNKIYLKV